MLILEHKRFIGIFHGHKSFWSHYGPGVDSASNRNEYQEYFLGSKDGQCVGLTTLPPSRADCHEIWKPQTPGTFKVSPGQNRDRWAFPSNLKIKENAEFKETFRKLIMRSPFDHISQDKAVF
jgi:hypothetical protein